MQAPCRGEAHLSGQRTLHQWSNGAAQPNVKAGAKPAEAVLIRTEAEAVSDVRHEVGNANGSCACDALSIPIMRS